MARARGGDDREEDEDQEGQERDRNEEYVGFRRTLDEMKRTHKAGETDSERLKQQGNQFFALGCFEQASLLYSEAMELQPRNPVLYCNRAMTYLKQGLVDEALADAETSLELDSSASNIKAHWRKAQALLELERSEEAEAAADLGLSIQPANTHLNGVRRKAREATTMRRLSMCDWVGEVQQGIEKRMTFSTDGIMTIHIMGHKLLSTFDLSVEGNPRSMYIKMKNEGNVAGTGPPPPPIPYIFEFRGDGEDEELCLCHPVGTNELPRTFDGPGFSRMRRAQKEAAGDATSSAPLDERAGKYMEALCELLPVLPPQLPERPSDEQISHEVLVAEKMAKLKRTFGLQVHQRAVELARNPASVESDELKELARGLQARFVARKIFPKPAEETPTAPPTTQLEESAARVPSPHRQAPVSCFGRCAARLCDGRTSG